MKVIAVIILPAFVELVLSHLFSMVDIAMLGHTDMSSVAISAVGLTMNPINIIIGVCQAFCIGITAAVAWSIGAGKKENARTVARETLTLSILIGIGAGLLVFLLAGNLVTFMGAKEDTFEYASGYLKIIAIGFPFQIATLAITASARGAGKTFLPMMYNLIANAMNVLFNYFLIFGVYPFPKLGIYGAAIATSLSKVIAFILALLMIFCAKTDIRLKIGENFLIHKQTVKRIAEVGITAALEQLIMQTGFVFFTKTVSILPTDIFSAHHISLNINGLAWVPSQAFGVAATSLVGQCVGKGDKEKAKSYARVIHLMSLCVAIFIGIMFIFFSKYFVMIYTNEQPVIDAASQVLKIIALGMPGIGTQIPISAALRGAKDTKVPLFANLISVWVFRVIVCNIFLNVFYWGIIGAWLTIVLDQTCRAVIVYTRFLRGKWLNKKITT